MLHCMRGLVARPKGSKKHPRGVRHLCRHCCLLSSVLSTLDKNIELMYDIYEHCIGWTAQDICCLTTQSCSRMSGLKLPQLFIPVSNQKLDVSYCEEHFAGRS